jgi:UDP-N-acetylglucosamine:LPS N-acetylglucosamine transferase
LTSVKDKTILFCVLNWGLGHATRSAQIIEYLLKSDNKIILFSDGQALDFLRNRFPDLKYFQAPTYGVKYPSGDRDLMPFLFPQIPQILRAINMEKKQVKALLDSEEIDLIISDNRYGCQDKNTSSIFLGHQLSLGAGSVYNLVNRFHAKFINKFSTLWVPDDDKRSLSGSLSSNKHITIPQTFIGDLGQFPKAQGRKAKDIDCLILLSGIEEQRQALESKLSVLQWPKNKRVVFVRGIINSSKTLQISGYEVLNFANGDELKNLLERSKSIVCRSGYSTIMDLKPFDLIEIFVPTPGQNEQIYLAKRSSNLKKNTFFINQKNITEEGLFKLLCLDKK